MKLPKGACDTHCHVFGPEARFPYDPKRTYTPADATKEILFKLHSRLGFSHAVVVQPACYGIDNSAMLDAIAATNGHYRGVALVSDNVKSDQIAALHKGGVRGVRLNFLPHLGAPPSERTFRHVAELIAPFGWHLVLHICADDLGSIGSYMGSLQIPFVIDHMARIDSRRGLNQTPFRLLLDLAQDPRAWVKISGADRASAIGPPFHDVVPFVQMLAAIAPSRVLWGTDWPHPNIVGPVPSEENLLAFLITAIPDAERLYQILVDNPGRLYRFGN